MRYYYIPIKMAKLQNTTSPNAGEKVEKQELSITVLDKVSDGHSGRQFGSFLKY